MGPTWGHILPTGGEIKNRPLSTGSSKHHGGEKHHGEKHKKKKKKKDRKKEKHKHHHKDKALRHAATDLIHNAGSSAKNEVIMTTPTLVSFSITNFFGVLGSYEQRARQSYK
jgi:hypothetical protein